MRFARTKAELRSVLQPFLENEKVREMGSYIQHGDVTTLEHCLRVALISYLLVKLLHLRVDLWVLLVGALLHDFYLYDWHDPHEAQPLFEMHGFTHARKAAYNARKYFDVDDRVVSVIYSHMFPLNLTAVPKRREAVIVCVADKIAATQETVAGYWKKVAA